MRGCGVLLCVEYSMPAQFRQSCVAVLRFDLKEWERLIGRPFGSRFWGLRLKRPFLIDQQRFDGIGVVGLQKAFFIISPLRVLLLPPPCDGDPYR